MRIKTFVEWLKENPPPDLQVLSEYYDGAIPDEAFKQFTIELAAWRKRLRDRRLEY